MVKKVVKKEMDAKEIWDYIKDLELEMFGLPGQFTRTYFKEKVIPGIGTLFLKTTCGPAIPALEIALGKGFSLEVGEEYITVTKKVDSEVLKENPLKPVFDGVSVTMDSGKEPELVINEPDDSCDVYASEVSDLGAVVMKNRE
jgi:hypothetical protein